MVAWFASLLTSNLRMDIKIVPDQRDVHRVDLKGFKRQRRVLLDEKKHAVSVMNDAVQHSVAIQESCTRNPER